MTQDAFPVFSFSQDCYSCVCHAGELPGLVVCPLSLENTSAVWALLPPPRPSLLAISGVNWNRDLSPWPAPNVFPQEQAFSGGSRAFLSVLSERLLPEAERRLPMSPVWRGIAGYSLAGLFALWCLWETDRFDRAASLSGSLWYDGFLPYLQEHRPPCRPERIYLSLGSREKHSKNPRLASVENCTRSATALFQALGIPTLLEMNPGGHFRDVAARIARGISYLSQ